VILRMLADRMEGYRAAHRARKAFEVWMRVSWQIRRMEVPLKARWKVLVAL